MKLKYKDFVYEIQMSQTVTIIHYDGDNEEVKIPSKINGMPVTRIESKAFNGNQTLVTVTVPKGIMSIASLTFANCPHLKHIGLPDTIRSISDEAFAGCKSLKHIYIPHSVIDFAENVVIDCPSLENIEVSHNNKYYSSQDGVLFDKDKTSLFLYPEGKRDVTYTTPKEIDHIADSAFSANCFLEHIIITDNVTKIGDGAFYKCDSLKSATLSNSLTMIPEDLFYHCSSLVDVSLPINTKEIGRGAFTYCTSLKNIKIPDDVQCIDNYAFAKCSSLADIHIPRNIETINYGAFAHTNLKSITIYNDSISLDDLAFLDCPPNLVIKCNSKSTAEQYAKRNNIRSEPISKIRSLLNKCENEIARERPLREDL